MKFQLTLRESFIGILLLIIIYSSLKRNYIEYYDTSLEQSGGNLNNYYDSFYSQNDNRGKLLKEQREEKEEAQKKSYIDYKQQVYTDILAKTKKVLDELKIPFFLSSGTCLGYFREDKFIDHDYDIDLGIFEKDYNPELIEKMSQQGLQLYRVLGTRKDGMELSFKKTGTKLGKHAKVDIFLHYPETEIETKKVTHKQHKNKMTAKTSEKKEYYSWYSYKAPKFEEKIKYRVGKFNLVPVKFMGLTVNSPHPTLTYILDHYGEDWVTPKKAGVDYYYATSPRSIQK